jgi:hypothetical protein
MEMPNEIARLEGKYPAPPPEPVSTTDTGDEAARLLNRYPAPPPAAQVPPGPGARNQPPVPTAAQPTAPAATGPGIPSLTAANVGAWETDLRNDYKQIGTNAPNVEAYREHEARKQAAQRALFEAQQGGSEFSKVFGALAGAGVLGSRDGSAAAKGLLGLHGLKEQQRVARPEFDLQMTEQDIKEAQRLMEMDRTYKDKAVGDRAGVSRPMAEQESRDAEAMRRELSRQEDAARAAGVAFDREQALEEIKHKYRMREQAARPSGAGGDPSTAQRRLVLNNFIASAKSKLPAPDKFVPKSQKAEHDIIRRQIAAAERELLSLEGFSGILDASDVGTGGADPGKVDTSNPLLR